MKVIFDSGQPYITVRGLYQWDFGQMIQIYGLDIRPQSSIEVHFSQSGMEDALRGEAEYSEGVVTCRIPDSVLATGLDITVHLYVTTPDYGKTIRTIKFPVIKRKKPEDYEGEEYHNLAQKILQSLKTKADNLSMTEDGWLQLCAGGTPIGDRVRVQASGREIELRNDGESIQWRYTDSNEWNTLVALSALKGEPGETPEFELRDGHIFAIYQN